nr:ABC transporter ATP-binding protein [Streptococcus saliviloxodontae]
MVFENISVDIEAGQYLILMGENGQGKSTFIDLITGFKKADQGTVFFNDQPLDQLLSQNQSKHRFYAKLGILFQDVDMQLFNQTVYDEVAFGLRQMGQDEATIESKVRDVLGLLNIEKLERRIPYQLSGGEKKKVALASIIAMNPDAYILDEPFNNLAKEADELFKELLYSLHSLGKTIVMSSHHFKHVHHEKADILLFTDKGVDYYSAQEVNSDANLREILSHY